MYLNDSKAFVEYSNDMDDVYKWNWRIQFTWKTKNIDCIWWYDCWHA